MDSFLNNRSPLVLQDLRPRTKIWFIFQHFNINYLHFILKHWSSQRIWSGPQWHNRHSWCICYIFLDLRIFIFYLVLLVLLAALGWEFRQMRNRSEIIYSDCSNSAAKIEICKNIVCDMERPWSFRGNIRCSTYIIACEWL